MGSPRVLLQLVSSKDILKNYNLNKYNTLGYGALDGTPCSVISPVAGVNVRIFSDNCIQKLKIQPYSYSTF